MPSIIKKNSVILAVITNLCLTSFCLSETVLQEEKQIEAFDLSQKNDFIALDKYLSQGNLLTYFKIREKLLMLDYENLRAIKEKYGCLGEGRRLNELIDNLLSRELKDNIFFLCEDIFVNNVPMLNDERLFKARHKMSLYDFDPQEEHIYLNNLFLRYKGNLLLEKDEGYWINPARSVKKVSQLNSSLNHPVQFSTYKSFITICRTANPKIAWSYQLKDSLETTYFFDTRQWFKFYEENALRPLCYNGTVILRNEYRVFCIDLASGKEIWSFAPPDQQGYEFYQKFRHPNQNSFGYELLIEDGILFAELGGKLIALRLTNILEPELLWERNLGEYTLSAKPVKAGEILIVGFINSKKELWMCGFNSKDGTPKWNTYIGTSSMLSPVSELYLVNGSHIFVGMNHGVVVCLDYKDGSLVWERKYLPKKYSLFEFWEKGYYADRFTDRGSFKFDTQIITIDTAGSLYYKPRESDYLYILGMETGDCIRKILIDQDKYILLTVNSGLGVFLMKAHDSDKANTILTVDLNSGKEVSRKTIKNGTVKGVYVNGNNLNELILKINDTIYVYDIEKQSSSEVSVNGLTGGWLLEMIENRFLLLGDGRNLYCLDVAGNSIYKGNPAVAKYLVNRESILKYFTEIAQQENSEGDGSIIMSTILSSIKESPPMLEYIVSAAVQNKDILKNTSLSNFLFGLPEKQRRNCYIEYCDINLNFKNFIKGVTASSVTDSSEVKNRDFRSAIYSRTKKQDAFQIEGGYLLIPVTVEVVSGDKTKLDFFLVSDFDQLVCVDESTKTIRWERRIFYNPTNYMYLYHHNLDVYLYEDTLIINDGVNIIAVDVHDGRYSWSFTNKGEGFKREIQGALNSVDPEEKKKLHVLDSLTTGYIKNVLVRTRFIDDTLIITHGNKVYSVNPRTGYCYGYRNVALEGIGDCVVSDKEIFLLSVSSSEIVVLTKDLRDSKLILLKNVEPGRGKDSRLFLLKEHFGLFNNSHIYLFDKISGALRFELRTDDNARFIEACSDALAVIVPFRKVTIYGLADNVFSELCSFDVGGGVSNEAFYSFLARQEGVAFIKALRYSKFYLFEDRQLFFPFRRDDTYFLSLIDIGKCARLWERPLPGFYGDFCYLSNMASLEGGITFIMSTKSTNTEISPCVTRLLTVDRNTGDIKRNEKLYTANVADFKAFTISDSRHHVVYRIPPSTLRVESKE